MGIAEREQHATSGTASIRVAVVDPRRFIAEALGAIVAEEPSFDLVGTATGTIAAAAIAIGRPDLVLVGVGPDEGAVLTFLDTLMPLVPGARVLLLADRASPRLIQAVLDHALGGLLLTDGASEDLVVSLRHIAHGQAVLPGGWQAVLATRAAGPLDSLSDRQLEVLRLLAEGCSYEEIGARLFISLNTVKFHTRSIFERLGVRNRTAAAHVLAEAALGQAHGWPANHPNG